MAYTITNVYALDPTYTGASLRAQLYSSTNAAVGSPISTGFYERAGLQGIFAHSMSVPDDHVGWCDVYDNAAPTVVLVSFPINPRELEYSDIKSSLISTSSAASVWAYATRTLTAFGDDALVEFTYTLTDSVSSLPLPGVTVRISTDIAGDNTIWVGTTDTFGVAKDAYGAKPRLDTGTYYFWRSLAGYSFSDPDTEAVS